MQSVTKLGGKGGKKEDKDVWVLIQGHQKQQAQDSEPSRTARKAHYEKLEGPDTQLWEWHEPHEARWIPARLAWPNAQRQNMSLNPA